MSTNNAINKKSGGITLMPSGTNPGETGEIRFQELAANGNNHVAIKAPDSLDDSSTYTLPAALPTGNRVLQSDATGKLSWVSAGGGGGGGSLADLSDVTLVNPQPGEALRYDGSEWKNQAIPPAITPRRTGVYIHVASNQLGQWKVYKLPEITTANRNYRVDDYQFVVKDATVYHGSPHQEAGTSFNLDIILKDSGDIFATKKRRGVSTIFKIKGDGSLWGFGRNNVGQLGDGSTTNRNNYVQIGSDTDWKEVFHHFHAPDITFAVKNDGTLWSWGINSNGATGHGATSGNTLVPTQVGSDDDWLKVIPVTTGTYDGSSNLGNISVVALKTDGTLWSWGSNTLGLTGQGTTSGNTLTPTQIGADNDWVSVEPFVMGTAYNNNAHVACYIALKSDGTLWSWGSNAHYMTGHGTASGSTNVPTQIGADSDWVKIMPMYKNAGGLGMMGWSNALRAAVVALKNNGHVYIWGSQNTNGGNINVTTPTRMGDAEDVIVDDIIAMYPYTANLMMYIKRRGNSIVTGSYVSFSNLSNSLLVDYNSTGCDGGSIVAGSEIFMLDSMIATYGFSLMITE